MPNYTTNLNLEKPIPETDNYDVEVFNANSDKIDLAIKTVEQDLASHTAEKAIDDVHGLLSAGKIIQESGSNANGEYVRFADGTQMCWRSKFQISNWFSDTNQVYDFTFPATFTTRPRIFLSAESSDQTRRSFASLVDHSTTGATTTSFKAIAVEMTATAVSVASATMVVNYLAIGRWK